jgi:hypothetical protein
MNVRPHPDLLPQEKEQQWSSWICQTLIRQMPKPVTLQMAWSFSLSRGRGPRADEIFKASFHPDWMFRLDDIEEA